MQQLGDAQHEISMQLDRLKDADDKSKAEALALVCMFLGQGLPKAKHPVQFAESMERVVPLISSEAPEIRKNALAVVTATLNNAEDGDQIVDVPSAGKQGHRYVQMDRVTEALTAHADDEGTQINGLYCLAELAGAREGECMQALLDAGVGPVIEGACGGSAQIAEAAMHVLCSAAARAPAARPELVEQGALRAAVALLPSTEPDIQVRACMLLAMLTGGAPEAQAALAATPGAATAILGVMRGPGGDAEARAVAQQLFKMLAANPDTKAVVEAALRGTPAS